MKKLIILEGINGSGKSSVYNLLEKEMDNEKFDFVKYPVFLDKEKANKGLYTYKDYAIDRYDYNDILLKILSEKHVIADRYILSNYAYFTKQFINSYVERYNKYSDIDFEEMANYDEFDTIYIANKPSYCYENLMKYREDYWNVSSLELERLHKAYLYAFRYYFGSLKNSHLNFVKSYDDDRQLSVRELTDNVKKLIENIVKKFDEIE